MRRFSDYSKLELAELNEDQINELIELEIAYAGVKPVIAPKQSTLEDVGISANVIAFELCGLVFENESDAVAVSGMKILQEEYDWNLGSDYRWCERERDKSIKKKFYYKREDVRRVQKALSENKHKKEIYDKDDSEYKKYIDKTSKVRNDVWEAVDEAKTAKREIDFAKQNYEKYLGLSDNNKDIANKFFIDAYKESPEIIEVVLGIVLENKNE